MSAPRVPAAASAAAAPGAPAATSTASAAGTLASRRTALLQNLAAVATWSLAPTMIHAIVESFPVNFQNACRYLVSLLVLWPVVLVPAGRERRALYARILRAKAGKLVLIALANYAFQVCYTYSLSFVMPSVMSLVSQTQVLFGVLFAVLFFRDERAFMGRPLFIMGMFLALGGVALVICGGTAFGTPAFGVGVLLVVGSAFSWALLGALLRAWMPEAPPLLSISAVFTIVTPLFVATYAATHAGFPIPRAPAAQWLIMLSAGLLAVGLGQSLFYRAVPVLGVSVTSSIGLLTPLLASLVSFAVYGERLTLLQVAGGAVLICGSWLVVRARFRTVGTRSAVAGPPSAAGTPA